MLSVCLALFVYICIYNDKKCTIFSFISLGFENMIGIKHADFYSVFM